MYSPFHSPIRESRAVGCQTAPLIEVLNPPPIGRREGAQIVPIPEIHTRIQDYVGRTLGEQLNCITTLLSHHGREHVRKGKLELRRELQGARVLVIPPHHFRLLSRQDENW